MKQRFAVEYTSIFFMTSTGTPFIFFNELRILLLEIKPNNLIVSNSEIITLDFTVSKKDFVKQIHLFVD